MNFTLKAISHRDELLSKVIALGDRNSKTLGMFPKGAFMDHAKKKTIIVAIDGNNLAGYILFRISQKKRVVSIAHLCIDEGYRKQGIPKLLLSEVKDKYKNLFRGISLTCREDYESASKLWRSQGFKPVNRKQSRSTRREHHLINWLYDFGNPDLFSHQEVKSTKVKALLDCSVIIPMSEAPTTSNAEAHSLKSDWLTEEADFLYAPEVFNELNRDRDKTRASRTREFLKKYDTIKFKPEMRDQIIKSLESLKGGETDNDISDRIQLAECIASGTPYFITLDKEILDLNEELYRTHSLYVLSPTDFILMVDELSNTFDYYSFRLAGATYEQAKIKSNEITSIITIFSGVNGKEKQHELRDSIVKCASDAENGIVRVVKNSEGERVAVYSLLIEKNKLEICSIRIKKLRISLVLFQQLIRDIINFAVERQLLIVQVNDKQVSEAQQSILISMGFTHINGSWRKLTMSGVYTLRDLTSHALVKDNFDTPFIIDKISSTEGSLKEFLKLELERKLWPAKISDISIPVYIIPIRPRWAGHLFDFFISNSNLFGANEELAWSRENIYYRSVKPVSEKAPARILWYLSSESKSVTGRSKGIAACSYLDEVYVNNVKAVFNKFKHYGIYEWRDVYKLANGKLLADIKALKFSDTEVFKKIVPLNRVHKIMEANRQAKNSFASPVEVSIEIFNAIYKVGKNE